MSIAFLMALNKPIKYVIHFCILLNTTIIARIRARVYATSSYEKGTTSRGITAETY
jgi:hypothetical protein